MPPERGVWPSRCATRTTSRARARPSRAASPTRWSRTSGRSPQTPILSREQQYELAGALEDASRGVPRRDLRRAGDGDGDRAALARAQGGGLRHRDVLRASSRRQRSRPLGGDRRRSRALEKLIARRDAATRPREAARQVDAARPAHRARTARGRAGVRSRRRGVPRGDARRGFRDGVGRAARPARREPLAVARASSLASYESDQAALRAPQPEAGREVRQAVPRHGRAVPRPDPGRQPRPDPRGREVRPSPRAQVLDLRGLVDPPGDDPRGAEALADGAGAVARLRPAAPLQARGEEAARTHDGRTDADRDRGGARALADRGRSAGLDDDADRIDARAAGGHRVAHARRRAGGRLDRRSRRDARPPSSSNARCTSCSTISSRASAP